MPRSIEPVACMAFASALLLVLGGCATGSKRSTIPDDGPTMAEVYKARMTAPDPRTPPRELQRGGESRESAYQRDARNQVDPLFRRLPNPDLVMYVPPHLSGDGYPVPGYTTVFPMYLQPEYAMPGEVADER